MNISSAQQDYSITSSDTITLSSGSSGYASDVITIDLSNSSTGSSYYTGASVSGSNSVGTVVIGGGAGATYTYSTGGSTGSISAQPISSLSLDDIIINFPTEWADCFPDWERIQKMCELYPGLKIAFEKFKTTYNLVKDDYDTPPEKRIKP